MIVLEDDAPPVGFSFDVALVAIGYERRCRWVTEQFNVRGASQLGLEFGFLTEGSYWENLAFFKERGCQVVNGVNHNAPTAIAGFIRSATANAANVSVFVDISSMSREMIANVALGISEAISTHDLQVTVAYAPSKYSRFNGPAPIRHASPIKPSLAGWSAQPEKPLGVVFGLGCEPGLARISHTGSNF